MSLFSETKWKFPNKGQPARVGVKSWKGACEAERAGVGGFIWTGQPWRVEQREISGNICIWELFAQLSKITYLKKKNTFAFVWHELGLNSILCSLKQASLLSCKNRTYMFELFVDFPLFLLENHSPWSSKAWWMDIGITLQAKGKLGVKGKELLLWHLCPAATLR